MLFFLIMSPYN